MVNYKLGHKICFLYLIVFIKAQRRQLSLETVNKKQLTVFLLNLVLILFKFAFNYLFVNIIA